VIPEPSSAAPATAATSFQDELFDDCDAVVTWPGSCAEVWPWCAEGSTG